MTKIKVFETLITIMLAIFLLAVGGCLTPGTIIASLLIAVPITKKILQTLQASVRHC